MGSLIYQKAFRKQLKKTYKGLDKQQRKYIKAKERFDQMDKGLNYFYSHCKRTENGAVDWDSLTESELDTFEWQNKEKNRALSVMNKLENVIDVDFTLNLFLQINTHSMSF